MKKIKHDHKGTKLLKLGIFASLMLAPLLAIAFKCAYVTFNKNAYQSYSGINTNEFIEETPTSFNNGQEYFINIQTNNLITTQTTITLEENISNLYFPNMSQSEKYNIETTCNNISFLNNSTSNMYISFRADGTTIKNVNIKDNYVKFSFVSSNYTGSIEDLLSYMTYRIYNNDYYLDDAFYYAIDEMKNNELFNWTTSTALYTPTAAMTNGMGITTNALPILITYWLYLTAIYIVIDIITELFTALTHMLTSKLDT